MLQFRKGRFAIALLIAGGVALSVSAGPRTASADAPGAEGILPTEYGESVDRDIAKVRAATSPFRTLEKAVAAGYPGQVSHCIDNPPHGAMGFHHQNSGLLDDKIEVERPEILVYERLADGKYRLNGVEYVVPLSAWPQDEPPAVMGQKLKRAPSLGIWYLHVWVWERNPSGLFADWNPNVKC